MLKLCDIKEGDVIKLDAGFTCVDAGKAKVKKDDDGLYFACRNIKHYLDGQEDDEGNLVGITN